MGDLQARFAGRIRRTGEDGSSYGDNPSSYGDKPSSSFGDAPSTSSSRGQHGDRYEKKYAPEPEGYARQHRERYDDDDDDFGYGEHLSDRGAPPPPARDGRAPAKQPPRRALPKRYVAPGGPAASIWDQGTAAPPGAKQLGDAANERLVKQPRDQLFFSRKARPVNFEPYTLQQYRQTKPEKYYELGKLQPDLQRTDLVAKRQNADRIKEFSKNLRDVNLTVARQVRELKAEAAPAAAKADPPSKRDKAAQFARNIPKPKAPKPAEPPPPTADPPDDGWGGGGNGAPSRLDELEARHDHHRALADGIRRQYNY
ncbi:hypothetical protein M885DRAFT_617245 [Pelagophyceae sp. CCMP2097]|nr:hypothetical protein M885DRAFT_617245 [Pelagophyceae sp. CCMP2097]